MAVNALEEYRVARDNAWQRSRELGWLKKLSLSLVMACLVGLLAQARILLPWTPVPITGSDFCRASRRRLVRSVVGWRRCGPCIFVWGLRGYPGLMAGQEV